MRDAEDTAIKLYYMGEDCFSAGKGLLFLSQVFQDMVDLKDDLRVLCHRY